MGVDLKSIIQIGSILIDWKIKQINEKALAID